MKHDPLTRMRKDMLKMQVSNSTEVLDGLRQELFPLGANHQLEEIAYQLIELGWCPPGQHRVLVADHQYMDDQIQELADELDDLREERMGSELASVGEVR